MKFLKSAGAVLAGYVAIGICVVLTDMLFAKLIPGFSQMRQPPLYYFLGSLATDTLYSVLGGWICARLAQYRPDRHTLALIVMGELIGAGSQIALWNTVPHWFGVALLITYPPAVWIGSKLASHGRVAAATA